MCKPYEARNGAKFLVLICPNGLNAGRNGKAVSKSERDGSEIASAYVAGHDLREVFSRENTERRRTSGSTLRKHLTTAQERKMTQAFVAMRKEYDISNNSDAVLVWVQSQIAAGKEADFDDRLIELANSVTVPKRAVPWDDESGH